KNGRRKLWTMGADIDIRAARHLPARFRACILARAIRRGDEQPDRDFNGVRSTAGARTQPAGPGRGDHGRPRWFGPECRSGVGRDGTSGSQCCGFLRREAKAIEGPAERAISAIRSVDGSGTLVATSNCEMPYRWKVPDVLSEGRTPSLAQVPSV